jgi:alanine dehydrogenase
VTNVEAMHIVSAAEIARLLPMPDAIAVVSKAFAAISRRDGQFPKRMHLPLRDGDALVMPGYDGANYLGTKIVTVRSPQDGEPGTKAAYVLFDVRDVRPVMFCDGTALTALRTGAATGLATRRLARADAHTLALFGVGGQAAEQLAAVLAARSIKTILVVGRDAARVERFVYRMRERFPSGPSIEIGPSPEVAVRSAQVIVTATSSRTPVFDGSWVAPGTHVNAIGSFRPEMRELDTTLLRRARIVVDEREAALAESGELIRAVEEGCTRRSDLVELGEIGDGAARADDEITVFKTVGHAALDLFTAVALLGRMAQSPVLSNPVVFQSSGP